MMTISEGLQSISNIVWGYPVVGLCLLASVFYSLRLGLIQIRLFYHAIELVAGKYNKKGDPGMITPFQALAASISGTVGIGNIAGVAIAIVMGGPGAIFWMWVMAFLGMAAKFAEVTLGHLYRDYDKARRQYRGGAMFYITKGMGERFKFLAIFFSVCLAIGALGIGCMFQSNQIAVIFHKECHIPCYISGIILAIAVGSVTLGGVKRIAKVASLLVPFVCGLYLLSGLTVCILHITEVPQIFSVIFHDAFTGSAVAGGSVGAVIKLGIRRAIFSNEAGLGTAPIIHAVAKTPYPVREGIVAALGPFIDTIVICTVTTMVVLLSGVHHQGGTETGIALATDAFNHFMPTFGTYFIPFAALIFGFTTMITWCYYGESGAHYCLGNIITKPYRLFFAFIIALGAVLRLNDVINFSDILTGLIVIPNGIAILYLYKVVVREVKSYRKIRKEEKV
jgi:AGCS family alanine or glycine:cation symporter